MSLPILAGIASTAIFALSVLPMLSKAARTRDVSSYSLGSLALANVGNFVHSIYVLHLPPGPIWVLHGLYLTSYALMLFWYLRFRRHPRGSEPDGQDYPSDASTIGSFPGSGTAPVISSVAA